MLASELQEVVQTDEVLVRELSLHPTPVVRVGELQFEKTAYLEAARAAANGKQGKARAWRSREEVIFEIAPAGMMIKRPSGQELNITDPLVALLSERPEERFAALSSRPDWFDCDINERRGVIDSIVQVEDDISRVEQAERWRESSAAVFYGKLAHELERQGSFKPDDLRPPNAKALFRYYRLSGGCDQIESGSEQIAGEFGVYQAFVRYAGFPAPLPAALVERISNLPEVEKRQLVKSILRTAGSPVSEIHLLHLLAHLAESRDSKYWRLAKRVTKALISSEAAPQFSAFQALLHWSENAFAAWPEAKNWSVADRIAMVWAHTHRVFSSFTYLGINPAWTSERFRRPDFGLSHDLFGHSAEYCQDIAHPRRLARESFVLSGLSYAAAGKDSDWWNDSFAAKHSRSSAQKSMANRLLHWHFCEIPLLRAMVSEHSSTEIEAVFSPKCLARRPRSLLLPPALSASPRKLSMPFAIQKPDLRVGRRYFTFSEISRLPRIINRSWNLPYRRFISRLSLTIKMPVRPSYMPARCKR